jgi:hypothetical protein
MESLPYDRSVLTEEDKQWISQRLEKVETTLLTEFHKMGVPPLVRVASNIAPLVYLPLQMFRG